MIPRQPSPCAGTPLASSTAATSAPVIVSAGPKKSNLELLYEATPDAVMPAPLKRNDYPDSRFWEKHMWSEWSKKEKEKGSFSLRTQGQGVNSSWMEDENGNRVSVIRQRQILDEARHTWLTMWSFDVGFSTYTKTPVPTLNFFRARMGSKFLELQLCADHWKTDELWKENYSSWHPPTQAKPQAKPQANEPKANNNKTLQPESPSEKASQSQQPCGFAS